MDVLTDCNRIQFQIVKGILIKQCFTNGCHGDISNRIRDDHIGIIFQILCQGRFTVLDIKQPFVSDAVPLGNHCKGIQCVRYDPILKNIPGFRVLPVRELIMVTLRHIDEVIHFHPLRIGEGHFGRVRSFTELKVNRHFHGFVDSIQVMCPFIQCVNVDGLTFRFQSPSLEGVPVLFRCLRQR